LRQALSTQGFDVTVAHNVLDGFFWLRAGTPSVVMFHTDLKPFRGLDVITSLRALPAFTTLPVILFGGSDTDQSAALKAGATQYLVSSAQVQELVAAVVTSIKPAAA
jgi:DNA-binding response OmpR family regulator